MPTYSYKGYDFDVDHDPTEEEFSQMSAYVDTLPPKDSTLDKIKKTVSEVAGKVSDVASEYTPQSIKNAVGGVEAVGAMIANTPDWFYNIGSRIPGKLAGVDVGEGDHLYQVHPATESGKKAEEMLGEGFSKGLSFAGKAITKQDQAIRKATDALLGTKTAYQTPEELKKAEEDHAFGAEGLMAFGAAKALPKQVMGLKDFKVRTPKEDAIRKDLVAEEQGQVQKTQPRIQEEMFPQESRISGFELNEKTGRMENQRTGEYIDLLDNIIRKAGEPVTYEKPIAPKYPGKVVPPMEDGLFSKENLARNDPVLTDPTLPRLPPEEPRLVEGERPLPELPKTDDTLFEQGKNREIEQTWEQKKAQEQAESSAAKEDAFDRAEAEQAPISGVTKEEMLARDAAEREPTTMEPRQGTSGLFGFGKPSPLGGVGKKQGGAIGFGPKKPPTYEQFKKEYNSKGEFSDNTLQKIYDKYYGPVKVGEPQAKAFTKATGLLEVTSLKPVEEMIPRWEVEGDLSSNGITKALRENLSSGGRMTALRTGNSFVDWSVEHILTTIRETQVEVKKLQNDLKGEVKKSTGNLLQKMGGSEADFVKAMGEMLKVKGTDAVAKIPESQKVLVTKLRQALDNTGKAVQDTLAELGYKNFHWRNNYLSGVFNGPYRSVATITDAKGVTHYLGVVAGKTKVEAQAGINWIRENMPEANINDASYNGKYDHAGTELGKRYAAINEVLNVIRNDDPLASRFQDLMESYYSTKMSDYFGYKQHMKAAKDIVGSEGNVPWRTAKDNAYDLFEAQLATMDQALHWVAKVKTEKQLRPLLNKFQEKMPQATEYVKQYYDHAYGGLENQMLITDNAISWAAETTGISPSQVREASAIIRNFALTNTLGASTAFLGSQLIQVPQALAVAVRSAKERGINANSWTARSTGMMDMWNYLRKNPENISNEGKFFADYATKYGIFDANLVEHTIHRKVIPTTGMGVVGKSVTVPVNVLLKGMDIESQMMGKAFIEYPESATRGAFFMSLAHYYRQAGYSLKEAAHLADKDTSVHFVDYSPQERAMGFQKMGELGKYMSTVSTFKLNALNQYPTFANKGMYATLATIGLATWMASGLLGMPGIDQYDYITNELKQKGLVRSTAKQYMLENWSDTANFGVLGQAPKLWGGPAMAIQTKFSQNDIFPDSIGEFLYPLFRFYSKRGEKALNYIQNPLPETRDAAIRENIPGNTKFVFEHVSSLTDAKGNTHDANDLLRGNTFKRDKSTLKHEIAFGVPTLDEYKIKYGKFMEKQDAAVTKEQLKKHMDSALLSAFNGDKEGFQEAISKYNEIDPVSFKNAFPKAFSTAAKARNIPANDYFKMILAEQAKTKPGIERFRRYKGMLDGSATTSK